LYQFVLHGCSSFKHVKIQNATIPCKLVPVFHPPQRFAVHRFGTIEATGLKCVVMGSSTEQPPYWIS